MQTEMKKTFLAAWHKARGANMVDYGGWDMPLWYPTGARSEHLAVITSAGLFDTSHMAVVTIRGKGAFELLQRCFTKDLAACVGKKKAPLSPGRSVYGAYLNERGEVVDDSILFQIAPDIYMTVVNCNMGGPIASHLKAESDGLEAQVADLTGRVGKIDLQGPGSAKVLSKVLQDSRSVLENMVYFSFKGDFGGKSTPANVLLSGIPLLLSRTGYTGEFGFEIFVELDGAVPVWETILSAGEEFGLIPCGLAARDSLRAGAVLPLSHQDIGPWPFINHPWPFALPYNEDQSGFTKEFIGDVILDLRAKAEHTYPFAGYDPRKVSIREPARVLDSSGNEIGTVLTCVADLAIDRVGERIYSISSPDKPKGFKPRGLCCGFVRVGSELTPGQRVELKDSRRTIRAMIVDDIRPERTARRPIRDFM